MYRSNKERGTSFERNLVKRLGELGFWAHFITPDDRGAQPFDVIAVKDGEAWAIECKTLDDKAKFIPLTRLEENQQLAFEKWLNCGNRHAFVAVMHKDRIRLVPYVKLRDEGKVYFDD